MVLKIDFDEDDNEVDESMNMHNADKIIQDDSCDVDDAGEADDFDDVDE